eukprot:TRINITY_DN4304_c1_g2_i2.p1 TRINITY_DN4304_c1_g2~~TRINITY_DN4304_c1_g2_i2.p1  ORF type:complete len:601 (+),score=40.54 TRINITY_DN4304_c1_g2_i2:566-2368(+)
MVQVSSRGVRMVANDIMVQQAMRYRRPQVAKASLYKLAETELQHIQPSDYVRDDCVKILHAYATCSVKHAALSGLISECARDEQITARDSSTALWASCKLSFMHESQVLAWKTLKNEPSTNDLIRVLFAATNSWGTDLSQLIPDVIAALPREFARIEKSQENMSMLISFLSKLPQTPQISEYVEAVLAANIDFAMCDASALIGILGAVARQLSFAEFINIRALVSRITHQISNISDPFELNIILRSASRFRFTKYSVIFNKLCEKALPHYNFAELDMDTHAVAFYACSTCQISPIAMDRCNDGAINKIARGMMPTTSTLQAKLLYALVNTKSNKRHRDLFMTYLDTVLVTLRRDCCTATPLKLLSLAMVQARLETHEDMLREICILSQQYMKQFNPHTTLCVLKLLKEPFKTPLANTKWFRDTLSELVAYAGAFIEYYSQEEVHLLAGVLRLLNQSDQLVWEKVIKYTTTNINPATLFQVTTACTKLRIISEPLLDAASKTICSHPHSVGNAKLTERLLRTFIQLSPSARGSQLATMKVLCSRAMHLDCDQKAIAQAARFLSKHASTNEDKQILRRLESIMQNQDPLREAINFIDDMDKV